MAKKRLFIGFQISPAVQAQVADWQRAHTRLPVRFVSGRNLHITLIPPWEEEDISNVKKIINELNLPSTGALVFNFNWVSFGPDPEEPRLIWAEAETPPGFSEIKYRLESSLWLPRDKKPLRPHLTVARFRAEDFRRFSQKTLGETVIWQEEVTKFTLYESRIGRNGPEYIPLADFDLK